MSDTLRDRFEAWWSGRYGSALPDKKTCAQAAWQAAYAIGLERAVEVARKAVPDTASNALPAPADKWIRDKIIAAIEAEKGKA